MDQIKSEQWWVLHVRRARGESLSQEEMATYESELKRLHDDEILAEDLPALRQARQAVIDLDRRCDQLQTRRQNLKQEIARLESALSDETRQQLGIED
jgi:cell division protein FtsB